MSFLLFYFFEGEVGGGGGGGGILHCHFKLGSIQYRDFLDMFLRRKVWVTGKDIEE